MSDGLHIRLLGEQELSYAGARIPLPPSKKTRALLSYLVLTGRAHRRERLCELLWDVADDPRAALRWSLTKLRELVDRGQTLRLLTDREQVRLELEGVSVDVFEVRPLMRTALSQVPTEQLERALALFRGELCEGLELPDFHAYHAFCLAEREALRGLHTRLLGELLERHVGRPEQALPLARKWVDLEPESEAARARFQQLLHASGRAREAALESLSSHRLLAQPAQSTPVASTRDGRERALGRDAASAPRSDVSQPLVGRAAELARLRVLTDVRAQTDAATALHGAPRARILLVSGEAGIGKTKLLRHFVDEASADFGLVCEGAAHEVDPGFPYAPFRDLFVRLGVTVLRPDDDASRRVSVPEDTVSTHAVSTPLHAPEGPARSLSAERERLSELVASALASRLRAGERVLLRFEDVHWFDEASAQLLHHLVHACVALPLVVVLSARRGELADNAAVVRLVRALRSEPGLEELTLGPLSREETSVLVGQAGPAVAAGALDASPAALLLARVPEDALLQAHFDRVYEQSAGNALLAIELARAGELPAEQLPPSIAQLVRERMESLHGELRELLRWAAVLGSEVRLDALEPLTALAPERLVDVLEQLERLGWVACDDRLGESWVRFSHALVHRAVYDGLSSPRRRLMHARAAQQLAARETSDGSHAAELARHAVLGGEPSTAVLACLAAGKRCAQLGAARDAGALARRALSYVERLPPLESCRLELELLELLFLAQRPAEHDPAVRRLHTLAKTALSLGQLEHARRGFFLQAFLRWEAGQVVDAQQFSREAERCSRLAGPGERLRGLADATRCLVLLERDLTEAQAFALEAEALTAAGEREIAGVALALGMLAAHGGAHHEAEEALERARSLARAEGDRLTEFFALSSLIEVALDRERWDDAESLVLALLTSAEGSEGSEPPFAAALQTFLAHRRGHATAEALEAALKPLSLADAKQRSASVLSRWSEHALAAGELIRARQTASEGLSLAQAVDRTTEVAVCLTVLLLVAQAEGDRARESELRGALVALAALPLSARARAAIARGLGTITDDPKRSSRGSKQDGARHRRARLSGAG